MGTMNRDVAWVAADWGTTHLRVWAIDRDHRVVAQANSDKGMNALSQNQFEPALMELVAGWLGGDAPLDVIACGMVGARQGWIEAEYVATPCPPLNRDRLKRAPTLDPRLKVLIVPGLKQESPADVMRGEETQIAGLLGERPGFEGTICMPGTHSKWVRIRGGEVAQFKTCVTGELFFLLETRSILRHSLAAEGFDMDTFRETINDALNDPGSTVMNLFSVRAGDLLKGEPSSVGRARLSGCLIAAEIHAARPLWREGDVILLGADELVTLYSIALRAAGGRVEVVDGGNLTIAGLIAARLLAQGKGHD